MDNDEMRSLLQSLGASQLAIIKGNTENQGLLKQILARLDDVHGAASELIGHTQELSNQVREVIEAAKPPEGGEDPFAKIEAAVKATHDDVRAVGEDVKGIPEHLAGAVEQVTANRGDMGPRAA